MGKDISEMEVPRKPSRLLPWPHTPEEERCDCEGLIDFINYCMKLEFEIWKEI